MRDGIELSEFANHGHQWTEWVISIFRRGARFLHWAGAAFEAKGLNNFR